MNSNIILTKIILLIFFLFSSYFSFGQNFKVDSSKVKHVEIISDTLTTDSIVGIDKEDVDVINNVFRQRDTYKDMTIVQDSVIKKLEIISFDKSSIISTKDLMIQQHEKIQADMKKMIENNNKIIMEKDKAIKSEKRKKTFWKSTTGICVAGIIIILLL